MINVAKMSDLTDQDVLFFGTLNCLPITTQSKHQRGLEITVSEFSRIISKIGSKTHIPIKTAQIQLCLLTSFRILLPIFD